MIKFDIITIFPEIFDSYFQESLIKRALKKDLIRIKIHNLRKWTANRHQIVDDRPYGGGMGMVMKVEPIYKAVKDIKKLKTKNYKLKTVLFTPRGKKFNQKMAYQFSKFDQLILICGRYEGIDERVAKYIADEAISIGDYVLMGGELPAMVVVETVARLIPGVLGKPQFLKERVPALPGRAGRGFIEYFQYTRPEIFSPRKGAKWRVPKVLLSGDHKKIIEWRKKHRKIISS
ncbi:MAG TPA: tRNA (guanosine(37)-N1)-methyltransferase TrmD [Candidatus Nealsonbacteria bacterium]|uniref:tRNA (guanine-N(1)-)-methyltransferase n=1 Tax=marine sediment metagenome TaxID=412755 RepID=A0A0F9U7N5_9ZZZZ|nr:tRNA (guanosine(37)-N1)-methyltransferase TrmD [Candidatus Nealsonbacteria bacterium]HEB46598.1 tRNA (guanosine(37)-N1)-methyltransferase TrmD [Candidatus Nealsonbacteria bacterium]